MPASRARVLFDTFMRKNASKRVEYGWKPSDWPICTEAMEEGAETLRELALLLLEDVEQTDHNPWSYPPRLFANRIMKRRLPWRPGDLPLLARSTVGVSSQALNSAALGALEQFARVDRLPGEIAVLLREAAGRIRLYGVTAERFASRIHVLAGAEGEPLPVQADEPWGQRVLEDLSSMEGATARVWSELILHCKGASGARATPRWTKKAAAALDAVGRGAFRQHVPRWFEAVNKPKEVLEEGDPEWPGMQDDPWQLSGYSVDTLRGLVWLCGMDGDSDLLRALPPLAISSMRKIPWRGPRALGLANACIRVLESVPGMGALGQLAILKVRIRHGSVRKAIEKAFDLAAEREGLPREQVEELGVPDCGLEDVGQLDRVVGSYTARIRVDASGKPTLAFRNASGKDLKSVPAEIKSQHAEELKELRSTLKDIKSLLPAQRERIDRMYLEPRRWPFADWLERYNNHPLVGMVARRLIWTFTSGEVETDVIWLDGAWVGSDGQRVVPEQSTTTVSLWHPLASPTEEVLAWRQYLHAAGIVQPFKQAHREVYLLTDAERNTGVYSNRFAAHIVKQHQFNALCSARGWENQLRLMVDDAYPPPSRSLAAWGLRAEYWVESVGEEHGVDTNEAGTFLHLGTDQVRFYREDAPQNWIAAYGGGYQVGMPGELAIAEGALLQLDAVPPLVFSEVMRDCDLFVGVASVGNDPAWADGGRERPHANYWHSYAFGELSETAKTRRSVLERVVPSLKISEQCHFEDRFLVVAGSVRTYKIHLGSGNILMKPNDEYLCIVPDASARRQGTKSVQLPFEGDRTLSLVLSKALMLANDHKIKDTTILSQIGLVSQ